MKFTPIEIEKQLETPVENDAQRELRQALEDAGPQGERWCVGYQNHPDGRRHCALGLIARVRGVPHVISTAGDATINALARAAVALGAQRQSHGDAHTVAEFNNAHRFPTVRKMFERAIELAA